MIKAIIFDTETTGLTLPRVADVAKQPRIIDIGIRVVDARNGNVIADMEQLINPEMVISEEITKIGGITNEMLAGKRTFKEIVPELNCMFDGVDMLLAHNAPFDVSVLTYELMRVGANDKFSWPKDIICTAHEYASLVGFLPRLTDLYLKVMGEELKQLHRAMPDVIALHQILVKDDFFQKLGVV